MSLAEKTSDFLQRLVSLTDERDLGMLEKSMLLTVRETLLPRNSYLYRMGAASQLVLAWHCSEDGVCLTGQPEQHPEFDELLQREKIVSFEIPGETGVLGYVVLDRDKPVSDEEALLIDGLLRIYHNFLSVLEESQKDKLTGLFNRRTFEARFQGLLDGMVDGNSCAEPSNRRLLGQDDEIWLGMVDIDNFKRINDTYGHLYGDEVLILVARFMRRAFRDHDLLFRFGGEEFAVMLQAPDKKAALAGFERFREAMESYDFPQIGKVTVSIGVTAMRGSEPVPAVMIGRADSALYHAKDNGRNQVVFEEDMPEALRGQLKVVKDDIELF